MNLNDFAQKFRCCLGRLEPEPKMAIIQSKISIDELRYGQQWEKWKANTGRSWETPQSSGSVILVVVSRKTWWMVSQNKSKSAMPGYFLPSNRRGRRYQHKKGWSSEEKGGHFLVVVGHEDQIWSQKPSTETLCGGILSLSMKGGMTFVVQKCPERTMVAVPTYLPQTSVSPFE